MTDELLYYFKSTSDSQAQGFIDLAAVLDVAVSRKEDVSKAHAFHLNTPNRVYYMVAENDAEVGMWALSRSPFSSVFNTVSLSFVLY